MFVKAPGNARVAGFAAYLLKIASGDITEKEHKVFVEVMQRTLNTAYVHNEDVDWFHVKQVD